jgi:hypothetical protein
LRIGRRGKYAGQNSRPNCSAQARWSEVLHLSCRA